MAFDNPDSDAPPPAKAEDKAKPSLRDQLVGNGAKSGEAPDLGGLRGTRQRPDFLDRSKAYERLTGKKAEDDRQAGGKPKSGARAEQEAARSSDQPAAKDPAALADAKLARETVSGPGAEGFRRGEAQLSSDRLQRLWNGIPEADRRIAQTDPNAVVKLYAHASSLGDPAANAALAQDRVINTARDLRAQYGIKASIEVSSDVEPGRNSDPSKEKSEQRYVQLEVTQGPAPDKNDRVAPTDDEVIEGIAKKAPERVDKEPDELEDQKLSWTRTVRDFAKHGLEAVPEFAVEQVLELYAHAARDIVATQQEAHVTMGFAPGAVEEFAVLTRNDINTPSQEQFAEDAMAGRAWAKEQWHEMNIDQRRSLAEKMSNPKFQYRLWAEIGGQAGVRLLQRKKHI